MFTNAIGTKEAVFIFVIYMFIGVRGGRFIADVFRLSSISRKLSNQKLKPAALLLIKYMKNKLIDFVGTALLVYTVFCVIVVRFSNPEMTETQLLINFWKLWLSIVVMGVCYSVLVYRGK